MKIDENGNMVDEEGKVVRTKEELALEQDTREDPEEGLEDEEMVQMSQDQFNALIKKRLDRQARNEFGDYEELKEKASRLDKLEEDQMSELEKTSGELEKTSKELEQRDELFRNRILEESIRGEAKSMGFKDLEYALYKTKQNEDVVVDDEYNVKGVSDTLKALAESNPDLLEKSKTKNINPTNPGENATDQQSIEERRARIFGSNVDVFDTDRVKQKGGGVLFPGVGGSEE